MALLGPNYFFWQGLPIPLVGPTAFLATAANKFALAHYYFLDGLPMG